MLAGPQRQPGSWRRSRGTHDLRVDHSDMTSWFTHNSPNTKHSSTERLEMREQRREKMRERERERERERARRMCFLQAHIEQQSFYIRVQRLNRDRSSWPCGQSQCTRN